MTLFLPRPAVCNGARNNMNGVIVCGGVDLTLGRRRSRKENENEIRRHHDLIFNLLYICFRLVGIFKEPPIAVSVSYFTVFVFISVHGPMPIDAESMKVPAASVTITSLYSAIPNTHFTPFRYSPMIFFASSNPTANSAQ